MSAEYVLVAFKEEMFSCQELAAVKSNIMGSAYFRWDYDEEARDKAMKKYLRLPHTAVGSCSFLKAALLDSPGKYIPGPIDAIEELFDETEVRECDDAFIKGVRKALELSNVTNYRVYPTKETIEFLEEHRGWLITSDLF